MALGLLGARGERHVHRRRSACDRAAFLWGLARAQAGAGEGTRLGRRRLWCGRRWRPRRGRDDGLQALPLPQPAKQLQLPGESPGRDGCWWRRSFGALFSSLSASLLARGAYVRCQDPNGGNGTSPGIPEGCWKGRARPGSGSGGTSQSSDSAL